jgi:[NiFe] hydrogenase large subunit
MANIVIDPVTRIEGHLRVETEVLNGKVSNAWSTSPLFRGIEPILKGRDPRDAWMITQRLCGVCTYVHGVTSIRSVENALGITIPVNARVIRNLLMGAQFIHDHIVNFYQLHLMDWVDVVSALSADPAKAVTVDRQINSARRRTSSYFSGVKQQLAAFANSGQLGPFNNGYWGHPAYILTPEENLVFMANYLEALKAQIQVAHMHAIYGGKNPHPQTMIVGGVTLNQDLTSTRITEFKNHVVAAQSFVNTYYLPDTTYLLGRYKDYASIGVAENLMSFGEFPQSSSEPSSFFFPRGIIFNRATNSVQPVDVNNISEHITHSWYSGSSNANPAQGQTVPSYSGLTSGQYSWIKAPRYQGQPWKWASWPVMVNYGRGIRPPNAVNLSAKPASPCPPCIPPRPPRQPSRQRSSLSHGHLGGKGEGDHAQHQRHAEPQDFHHEQFRLRHGAQRGAAWRPGTLGELFQPENHQLPDGGSINLELRSPGRKRCPRSGGEFTGGCPGRRRGTSP